MKQEKSLSVEVTKVKSLYKIIKNTDPSVEKKSCIIPVSEIISGEPVVAPDDPVRNSKKIIEEAEEKASIIIEHARKEAEKEAQGTLEALKEKTYQEAYKSGFETGQNEGYEAGQAESRKDCQLIRNQAKSVLEDAHKKAAHMIEKNEDEIIELSIYIAEQVLQTALSREDAPLIKIAQDAFREFKDKKHVIISIHPNKRAFYETNLDQLKKVCPYTDITLLEDEKVSEKGCVLESDSQVVDTQVEGQLERIKEALLEMGTSHGT